MGTSLRTSQRRNHSQIFREELVAARRFGRVLRVVAGAAAGAAATTAAATSARATTATGAARTTAARAATATGTTALAATTSTGAGTAALVTRTARATAATASARTTGRAADYGLRGSAEGMACGVAEGIECANNDDGDAHDQKSVFSRILTGFLAPKSFEKGEHLYDTFKTEGT